MYHIEVFSLNKVYTSVSGYDVLVNRTKDSSVFNMYKNEIPKFCICLTTYSIKLYRLFIFMKTFYFSLISYYQRIPSTSSSQYTFFDIEKVSQFYNLSA